MKTMHRKIKQNTKRQSKLFFVKWSHKCTAFMQSYKLQCWQSLAEKTIVICG